MQGFLDGVGAELQASESQELEESEMKERVHHALTRK
jgi:cofilin